MVDPRFFWVASWRDAVRRFSLRSARFFFYHAGRLVQKRGGLIQMLLADHQ